MTSRDNRSTRILPRSETDPTRNRQGGGFSHGSLSGQIVEPHERPEVAELDGGIAILGSGMEKFEAAVTRGPNWRSSWSGHPLTSHGTFVDR